MKPLILALCVTLMFNNALAADEVVAAPAITPAVIDVELPSAFLDAAPPPVPVVEAKPTEVPVPVAEILPYQVEVGSSYSQLSNAYTDWSSSYIDAEMKLAGRNNIYASARRENRYAKGDREFMGGFYDPINDHYTVVMEANMSPEHNFLPMRSVLSELEYNGSNGWGGEVGFRHTEYTNALVNLVNFTVERSWGNYRAAYMRFQGFLLGHDKTASNAIQGAKYYGDHNWFGVTISAGNELEVDATQIPSRVLSSHVSTVVFSGLHWLKPTLGLTYTLGNFHQGTSYVRNGMQLGLRRQF